MMRALVRSIFSTDVDVWNYQSDDPENDGVWVRFLIGPDNGPGEESFDLLICTANWVRDELRESGSSWVTGRLIVDEIDLPKNIQYAKGRFEAVSGKDWSEVANTLSRYAHWEFDGYRE